MKLKRVNVIDGGGGERSEIQALIEGQEAESTYSFKAEGAERLPDEQKVLEVFKSLSFALLLALSKNIPYNPQFFFKFLEDLAGQLEIDTSGKKIIINRRTMTDFLASSPQYSSERTIIDSKDGFDGNTLFLDQINYEAAINFINNLPINETADGLLPESAKALSADISTTSNQLIRELEAKEFFKKAVKAIVGRGTPNLQELFLQIPEIINLIRQSASNQQPRGRASGV